MTTTIKNLAEQIVDSAREAGATAKMLSTWELMRGDEDLVRAEYPSDDYPADAISHDEWRSVMAEVQDAVRQIGRDMQAAR